MGFLPIYEIYIYIYPSKLTKLGFEGIFSEEKSPLREVSERDYNF